MAEEEEVEDDATRTGTNVSEILFKRDFLILMSEKITSIFINK